MATRYTAGSASVQSNGTPSPFVTLISSDDFEFHVRRSAACVSGTIRRMLDPQSMVTNILLHFSTTQGALTLTSGNFSEAVTGRCRLENINGVVLQKVVEYFYYNEKTRDSVGVPDMEIPPELCLELLMAADYLDT
jgi:transcription elongation factor B subunit 1